MLQSIDHPRAPAARGIVRMDVFWSMWRSRTIPCPHGSGRPACETVLLHHEQFKIPENLARFAVRAGMTGFVKKLGPAIKLFVDERRQRVSPVRLPCCLHAWLSLVWPSHWSGLRQQVYTEHSVSEQGCISILCLESGCVCPIAYSLGQGTWLHAMVSHVLPPLCSLRMTAKDMACRTQ